MDSITASAEKSSAAESQDVPWIYDHDRLVTLCTRLANLIFARAGDPFGEVGFMRNIAHRSRDCDGGAFIRERIFTTIIRYVLTEREYDLSDEILSILSAERR